MHINKYLSSLCVYKPRDMLKKRSDVWVCNWEMKSNGKTKLFYSINEMDF